MTISELVQYLTQAARYFNAPNVNVVIMNQQDYGQAPDEPWQGAQLFGATIKLSGEIPCRDSSGPYSMATPRTGSQ